MSELSKSLSADPPPNVPTESLQAELAFELAAGLSDEATLCERYELTPGQLARLKDHPGFKVMVTEATAVWAADSNVKERVRAKAGFVVEDALLVIHQLIHNDQATPQARIEAFKQAVQVADMAPRKDQVDTSGKVTINITIPAVPGEPEQHTILEAQRVDEQD